MTGGSAPKRRFQPGRRRAAVLLAVHALIAIHLAHWARKGTTLSPLEPSEAMEFSKEGVVNAGLIFFALTIASTAVLGRWFCGWGCHLVALQDLCRWLLGRLGIRPRPVQSALLATVPLLAFLYMFVAPLAYRLLAGESLAARATHLTTSAFWETFPGWLPAVLTFVVCGFVAVYLLGSKGFCTNGCPYGAIFGVADQLSPLRIRVTDACARCGHCTAACSSNVRVHEEVYDFGMVVDPGCMKCLDCVSVCPNEALYYGAGRPALFAPKTPRDDRSGKPAFVLGSWIVLAAFAFAAFVVFTGSDAQRAFLFHDADWIVFAVLTVLTLAIVAAFRGKATRERPLALGEELLVGACFLAAMVVFRGLYGVVAFLFALGLSAVLAFLALEVYRLFGRRDISLPGLRLKHAGRWRPAAYGLLVLATLTGAYTAHAANVRFDAVRTQRQIMTVLPAIERDIAAGRASDAQVDQAIELYGALVQEQPSAIDPAMNLGLFLTARGRYAEARGVYERALAFHPRHALLLANYGILEATEGNLGAAVERFTAALEVDAALVQARAALAEALARQERWAEAASQYETLLGSQPRDVDARLKLSTCYARLARFDEAIRHLETAATYAPDQPAIQQGLAVLRARAAAQETRTPREDAP